MSARALTVYAVNDDRPMRHTNLTRATGDSSDLPDLAPWLGVSSLDIDRIEVFPVTDLGEMPLSQYVTQAFDPVPPIDAAEAARLDALEGTVLLVPDTAHSGTPSPSAEVTRIADLPLAEPDHVADLPKADVSRPVPSETDTSAPADAAKGRNIPQWAKFAVFIAIFIVLFILLDG